MHHSVRIHTQAEKLWTQQCDVIIKEPTEGSEKRSVKHHTEEQKADLPLSHKSSSKSGVEFTVWNDVMSGLLQNTKSKVIYVLFSAGMPDNSQSIRNGTI